MKTWLLASTICALAMPVCAWAQTDQAGAPPQGAFFPAVPAATVQNAPAPATPDQSSPAPTGPAPVAWSATRNVTSTGMVSCEADAVTSGQPFHLEVDADEPGKLRIALAHMGSDASSTLHFAFDNGVTLNVPADFENAGATTYLDASNMRPFIHGFTAANTMMLSVDGSSAAPTSYSLVGTTAAITALGMCAKDASIYLPAPFVIPNASPPQVSTATPAAAPSAQVAPSAPDNSASQPTTDTDSSSAPAPAPAPQAPTPGVVIQALTCEFTVVGPEVQGMVTNNTGESLDVAQMVFVFRSSSGAFVSTDNTYADYRPVLAGQTSPFTDYGGKNPVITSVEASVTDAEGTTIPTTGQLKADCGGDPNS